MDLRKVIQELYAEKEMLGRVIAALEELQGDACPLPDPAAIVSRRGRKSMGTEERLRVAKRMKAYWAARRNALDGPAGDRT